MSHGRFLSCSLVLLILPTITAENLKHIEELNNTAENCQQDYCERSHDENSTASNEVSDSNSLTKTISELTTSTFIDSEELWETSNQNCPADEECHKLPVECLLCKFNLTCVYGETLNVSCQALSKCEVLLYINLLFLQNSYKILKQFIHLQGRTTFEKTMKCNYCYQTSADDHYCNATGYCNSAANPVQKYRSNCTARPHVLCLGQRKFVKNMRCNWTSGYKWSTTFLLSITLGGFGADRFYLGHWQVIEL